MTFKKKRAFHFGGASWLLLCAVADGAQAQTTPSASTPLPEITVTAPSPIVRRKPAPSRTPARVARAAPGQNRQPAAEPQAAPVAAAPQQGVLPVVTDQFATVTVVPNEEIRRSGGATLGDLLFSKPGITGSSFAPGAASRPIVLPIGAGGGSIAWIDPRGIPQVGPQSSGAEPGPVCYGKGGIVPTVTDASAVLGLLAPQAFLGGRRELALEPAREAMEREIGKPLGVDAVRGAAAVYRMVTANMSNAVRTVTVERGHDPREFSMVAYGGALGIFAADIAREVGIRQVVIPADAAVFSAHGLLNSDDVRTQARSAVWAGGDASTISNALIDLDDQLVGALRSAGYSDDDIEVEWEGEFKYAGQQWELPVPLPRRRDLGEDDLVRAQEQYSELYEAEYGTGSAWVGSPVVLMSVRVTATGHVRSLEPAASELVTGADRELTPTSHRQIFLPLIGEETEVAVYDTRTARAGSEVHGPAILEHPLTTLQVPPGWVARVDEWGNFIVTDQTGSTTSPNAGENAK